ncbi:protein of unknown function [Flavobacterium glycines]|uniref:DUF4403 domain-containing protein n=1 Tax=Flavobacterium glycines TaxID=551990 RepID=A0A1B9DRW6_9FLAO|nr:DUF4403 family protein [Flavobacterium glycines]OCB72431.1 hypothetical protein FBGL_07235 [Flavobacterium glycines]GEL09915.1 hypothetical protein FGL01_06540 [Flavobacterium glycines]SDI88705.1 protein of unknown function [Flavobacterium glycines]
MKKIIYSLVSFCLLSFLSCSTSHKLATLKPEPDDASPIVYNNVPSFINLPISIKLKDIENKTNLFLNGLIYEDNNIEDDDIEMKIWKLAPITIKNSNDANSEKITTILPLKANIKYRIGTKTMGVSLYNTKEFNLNGIVTLNSKVNLNNWKLKTLTELSSLDWNESPTMTVFGKNMPVTYLINPSIKLFKSKIEKKIDEAIEKSTDFKPNVLTALEKICTPFQMNEAYESWLRIVPLEIYSTTSHLKNDSFLLQMGIKCNMETIIGQTPEPKFDSNKITLKTVNKIPNQINANIIAVSSYQDASRIMKKNFAGQEFTSGSRKVTVQDVNIWHKSGKMVIALDLTGSINGTIYLAGFPKYNTEKKEIYFDELDYVLDTKNKLLRTANWLAQGIILKKIQQNCRYSIKPNLDEGKKNMLNYMNNYSPMTGVFVNGKMDDIQFQKIELSQNAIIAFVKINGEINISVDGLE